MAESAEASSAIIQQMKVVMNSETIAKSVASGTIASSSMAMLREELTGEVRKRHGNKYTFNKLFYNATYITKHPLLTHPTLELTLLYHPLYRGLLTYTQTLSVSSILCTHTDRHTHSHITSMPL